MRSRWWIAILTVVGGASSNALWELGLKPAGAWFWTLLLNLVTLGSKQIKDSIYREAARGNHEGAALQVSATIIVFVITGFIMISGIVTSRHLRRSATLSIQRRAKRLDATLGDAEAAKQVDETAESLDDLRTERLHLNEGVRIKEQAIRQLRTARRVDILTRLFAIYVAVIAFAGDVRMSAANKAYAYFEQSLIICRPYIDEHTTQMIRSRYAQIRTRDDYVAVINDIRAAASANHVRLPEYEPW
jgi:hypothetical protein